MDAELPTRYCSICHLALGSAEKGVVKPYGVYHESCFFKACPRQPLRAAGFLMAFILVVSLPLAARPNPEMRCKNASWDGSEVRCEARYAWPVVPKWRTTAGNTVTLYGEGYGEGFGMDMKVSGSWTLIEMDLGSETLQAEVRVVDGKAQFRRP